MGVHRTAIIEPGAVLGDGVEVGPYCTIGPEVVIGENTTIGARVTIQGKTRLGSSNRVFDGAIIGCQTQDKKFDGDGGPVIIGDGNHIREYVTVSAGSHIDETTIIGDNNLLMAYCHIGHGSHLQNRITLSNCVTLAGHVEIEDDATVGGLAAIHQFTRIGRLSMIGGCSKVVQDVPPFMLCDGHPARTVTINSVGLKRAKLTRCDVDLLRRAHRLIFRSGKVRSVAIAELAERANGEPLIADLLNFMAASTRGVGS
ncbi:MAG TPA: acyl-ACP--UDP-N-acetylglucosamine O-acyltransferase [Pseudomonadales bacterium]|nr:acyl-ACP--UDP-N-acetylglucosamine O-acyltransferase [Pseudomonadales bacterium]